MTRPIHEADDDSRRCWELGIEALRETRIRSGEIRPDPADPTELRWASEGKRDPRDLDTVREAVQASMFEGEAA